MSDEKEARSRHVWDLIKKNVPAPYIIATGVLFFVFGAGFSAYYKLISNPELSKEKEYILHISNTFKLVALVVLGLYIVSLITISMFYFFSKKKRKESLPKGEIDAFIVKQDEKSRDEKFNQIYESVTKTYWVLGVSLTSVVEREATLKSMAKKGVKIQICMMNPSIAVKNLCLQCFKEKNCVLSELFEKIKNGSLSMDEIKRELDREDKYKSLLQIYNILIDVAHFNKFYDTSTDYREKVVRSYGDLKNIKNHIIQISGQESFKLAMSNAFIPMSMTIADADTEEGKMIVEFHLPFTQYKVLFEITKVDNKQLFSVFVEFYKKIWRTANDGMNEGS